MATWAATRMKAMAVCGILLLAVPPIYLGMSIGLPDALLITPRRTQAMRAVQAAASLAPPDVDLLCSALGSPDAAVAASAAERLEALAEDKALSPGQAHMAARALMRALGRGGNWWRFGWDREEPEFEGFKGATISAAAALGTHALPYIGPALESRVPDQREGACWVVCTMAQHGNVPQDALVQAVGAERIAQMASGDGAQGVRAACECARLALTE